MTSSNSPQNGIALPSRVIPAPSSISPQAQAILAASLPVTNSKVPTPDDKAGWKQYIATVDEGLSAYAEMQAKSFPAEIIAHSLSSAVLYEIVPQNIVSSNSHLAILYIHGGGFVFGGGQAAAHVAMQMASLMQVRILSIDYRMPPDHPFPAGLDDVVDAYRWLLKRYKPEHIAFYGPSAGGNLAITGILKARDLRLPLPAACAVHSPVSDLTESGDTYETNQMLDTMLRQRSPEIFQLYANGTNLSDPLLSPIHGDFSKGFPPVLLSSGTRDLLLSSTVLMHRALRRAGIDADLHVFEAMTHGGFFGKAPEDLELLQEHVQFMKQQLASR